jgi:peroxiredoxin
LIVGGSVGAWQWYQAWVTPEPAPHFNLPASTGKRIALTDYVGKQEVVLLFYMGAG